MEPLVYKNDIWAILGGRRKLRREQKARPDSWRQAWPDDPLILEARDLFSRLLRLIYGWPSDAFLPQDPAAAICRPSMAWDFLTQDVLVRCEMELLSLGVDVAGYVRRAVKGGLNFMELIEMVLENEDFDFEHVDHTIMSPFVWPGDRGWRRRMRQYFCTLRLQQVFRGPAWRGEWPNDPELLKTRDRVGPVLAEEFGWVDEAFVPGDSVWIIACRNRLKNMFSYPEGAALRIIRALGLKSDARSLTANDDLTYVDLLRRVQADG